MQIRGRFHGALPTVLAVVAVIVASSGTAVAVSSTTTISDPNTPARKARVDAAGRLTTVGEKSDINSFVVGSPNASGFADVFVVTTTDATVGVNRLSLSAGPTNTGTYVVTLYQVPVNPDGTCNLSTAWRTLSADRLAPGAGVQNTYPSPLALKPRGTEKYCLDVFLQNAAGTTSTSDYVRIQLTGVTLAGTYTGAGTGATKAATKDANGKTVVGN